MRTAAGVETSRRFAFELLPQFEGDSIVSHQMATRKETVDFVLAKLRDSRRFTARAMFGEYALYADGTVVALVCDDRLFVKILPASAELEALCEQGQPYPGAKPHYIVEEGQLSTLHNLSVILCAIAQGRRAKKKRKTRTR